MPATTGAILQVPAVRRHVAGRRPLRLLRLDPFEVLTIGLSVVAIAVVVLFGSDTATDRLLLLVAGFITAQLAIGRAQARLAHHVPRDWIDTTRLLLDAVFVALLVTGADEAVGGLPVTALYLPIVAMAAASGRLQTAIVGSATLVLYVGIEVGTGVDGSRSAMRGLALLGAATMLVFGTRRTVEALHSALATTRNARRSERRRARYLAGIEEVGTLLAQHGPEPQVLDQVLGVLESGFGYRHVSIYLARSHGMALGAQRGYDHPIEWFDSTTGVMGRILSTKAAAFVPDVSVDPDYRSADDAVTSEISAPLLDRDEVLGILNVESTAERPLDEADLRVIVAIADRLASAFALARERTDLAQRVDAFASVVRFGSSITRLDGSDLYERILSTITEVVSIDIATLVVLEPSSGRYVIRGSRTSSGDVDLIGVEIELGQGMAGRAIRDRAIARTTDFGPEAFPPGMRAAGLTDRYADAMGVPLLRDDVAVGAMMLGRIDPNRPFTSLEVEVLGLVAGQTALAISNAFLHEEVAALAVRDGLTGLFNRRHFDAAFEQLLAQHRRHGAAAARPLSVIIFDIDLFGTFNKAHGHQVGDDVLRRFATVLRSRAREADLVARYGGEEFVVVLDGAARADAVRVADTVRRAFGSGSTTGAGGEPLATTVSAGVAELTADAATAEALLRTADVGLFMAKRAGRNRVVSA